MRICISYTHPYPIKSLNHTLPFRICKLCFQANMQVTSTLWLDIKSQKLSEHRFKLRWTKSDTRTQFRQAKTGQDHRGPDKEAQDSLLDEAGVGWPTWQVDRPTGRPTWPMGPTTLTSPRVASPLVAEVGYSSLTPWLPAINRRRVEIRTHTHTPHTSHLSSLAFLA
jgi:hypothetical protein